MTGAGTASSTAGRYAAPRIPRRVSGPARKPQARGGSPRAGATTRGRTGASRARTADPLALRLLRRGQVLADSRLLDRLVRGRLWIPVIAVALVGVVFMQVSMLRLNSGIGRDVEAIGNLQRDNAVLRADVSRMESGERIQSTARQLGMVVPADGSFHYVQAALANAGALAAARMQPPDPEALARAQAQELANAQQATSPTSATTMTPSSVPGATGAPVATVVPAATTGATAEPAAGSTPTAATTPAATTPAATAPTPTAAPAATAGGAAAPTGAQG